MGASEETEVGSAEEQPTEGSPDQTKMPTSSKDEAGLSKKTSLFENT